LKEKGTTMAIQPRLRLPGAICIGALAISSAACTTPTKVTDVWRDPSYAGGPVKNVVVFGGRLDDTNRRTLEDGFVTALTAHAVRATPSYKLFPGPLPSKDEARAALQQAGVDGALVSSLRAVTEKATYIEGGPGFWGGFYGPGWGGPVYYPGYIVTEPVVRFETTLWELRESGKVIWSASTQTDNPSSGKDFVSSLTKKVIPEMVNAGVLPPPISGTQVSYAPSLLRSQ
jgi:hypothetical protein